jgi:fumarylacetoacetase
VPYLDSPINRESGALDIQLEVWLQTPKMGAAGHAGSAW